MALIRKKHAPFGVDEVARAVSVPVSRVRWEDNVPGVGRALVVHAPWARTVVARSFRQVRRFLDDYRVGRGAGLALRNGLAQQYPKVLVDWTDGRGLGETPLPNLELRRFIQWALTNSAEITWPVTPLVRVMGAWATWPDAVLLVRTAETGVAEYQLRAAVWTA